MKGWKILGILAIVGMFVMPMIPATKAATTSSILSRGDIVFGKEWYVIPQIPEWHHACLYRGSSYSQDIVQSDPHWENWRPREKWWWLTGQWDRLQNSLNSRGVGGVEYTTLSKIHDDYTKVAYGKVINVDSDTKKYATQFAEEKVGRHFDIVSYWKYKTKQVEGPSNNYSGWYYCAELVWAAYRKYGIPLDPVDSWDDHRVYPEEIYNNKQYVRIIYDEGIGW
ncbi:MAG: hypothetical protein J7K95_05275 [Thermoplasmata archaeon]|nr:hypothetical protein [Thermoplasmata archaeon]